VLAASKTNNIGTLIASKALDFFGCRLMTKVGKNKGFTLVELMVAVALVGVLALLAAPAVMRASQERHLSNATQSVLNLVEFSRIQAATRNRAYQLQPILNGGAGNDGAFQVIEGETSACQGFTQIRSDGSPPLVVRELDLSQAHPGVRLVSVTPNDLETSPLCFKPDGRVFQVRGDATPFIIPGGGDMASGDARIRLQRFSPGGGSTGPVRVIIVPFNGVARTGSE